MANPIYKQSATFINTQIFEELEMIESNNEQYTYSQSPSHA